MANHVRQDAKALALRRRELQQTSSLSPHSLHDGFTIRRRRSSQTLSSRLILD